MNKVNHIHIKDLIAYCRTALIVPTVSFEEVFEISNGDGVNENFAVGLRGYLSTILPDNEGALASHIMLDVSVNTENKVYVDFFYKRFSIELFDLIVKDDYRSTNDGDEMIKMFYGTDQLAAHLCPSRDEMAADLREKYRAAFTEIIHKQFDNEVTIDKLRYHRNFIGA